MIESVGLVQVWNCPVELSGYSCIFYPLKSEVLSLKDDHEEEEEEERDNSVY